MSAVLTTESLLEYCDDKWYSTTTGGHIGGCNIAIENLGKVDLLESSKIFELKYRDRLHDLFQDRLRMKGRYVSIANIDGINFGSWCIENGFWIYSRSSFASFFPNMYLMDEFSSFLDVLERNYKHVKGFYRDGI